MKAINLLAKEYQNNDGNILEELYNLNMEIGENLLAEDDIWLDWFVNELYNINVSWKSYIYRF